MIAFNKGLDGFFHSLIPARLQKTLKPNSAEYVRVRALTAVLVISTVVPAVATLAIGGYHFLFNVERLGRDTVSLTLTLLFAIQTGCFYHFGNRWLSAAAFTNIYFVLAVVLLLTSGGIASPLKMVVLTCPIVSFLIGGREEGLQSTLVTMLFILGLAALSAIEFGLPNLLYKDNPQLTFIANWLGTMTITAFCIMVYEAELQHRSKYALSHPSKIRQESHSPIQHLNNFINGLIPETLRKRLDPDSADYVRARTLSIMLWLAALLSGIATVMLASVHAVFFKDQLKYDLIVFAMTLVFNMQVWLFYKFSNFWLSSLIFMYSYLIMTLLLVCVGGGYHSPMISLLLISPIIFFMLGGTQQGIQNTVFVSLLGGFFGATDYIGFNFPSVFDAASPALLYGIAYEITVVGVVLCILVYDTELQNRDLP